MSQFEARAADAARPKRGNQYTARRAQMDAEKNAQRWQENPRYSAARLMQKLADHYEGKAELSGSQIKAIEIMLARVAPTLSAVEQVHTDPATNLDPAKARERLLELLLADPSLLQEAAAKVAKGTQTPIQSVNKAA